MPDSSGQNERASITTYIPAAQKKKWETHAEELEMSQSEFLRTMVQAGRRGFGESTPDPTGSSGSNPRGNIQETVLQAIDENDGLSWEELFEIVTNDLESQLEEAIITLQEADKITHQPRNGTYTLKEKQ